MSSDRPVCLVTGGSSGIGLATAIRFARENYNLVICGRDRTKLQAAQAEIVAHRVMCEPVLFDMADGAPRAGDVAQMAIENFGRIDVLVNNAACAPFAPFQELTSEQFEQTVDLNIRAAFYLTQRAWILMRSAMASGQQSRGVIINISSMAALDPFPGFSIYGASKSWIDLITQALAVEGKECGIQTFSVRPGAVETPLLRTLFPDFPDADTIQPADVAELIWGLCQPSMAYCSGQAISVKV